MNKVRIIAATVAASAVLSGCATGPNRNPNDPLEPMNRAMYKFNDTVDTNIAVPIAKGYQKITPTPMRTAISNFFSNLGDLGNMANNLLQLRITDATQDLMRVAMNSLFGVAGLIDIATPAGLPKHHQDFGLTMARWGVPSGPYLVLPVFGPSTFRDGVGRAVDVRFNLLNYIEPAARNPMYIAQFTSARSDLLGATDLLKQAALDPYSFVRDAYLQQRKSLTYHGQSSSATLPNYTEPGESGAVPQALTDYIKGREGYDYNTHGKAGNEHVDFVPDEIVDRFCVLGTADDHIEKLTRLKELGCDQFAGYLQHDNKEETLRVYGETVIPALSDHITAKA